MAKQQQISAKGWTKAQPATVYALLRDGATWPVWSPIGSFELVQEGPDGGESLGAIRLFKTGRHRSREEIIALEPNRRFGYSLLAGLPLKGYRAYIDLDERDGGTGIHWHSSFQPKYPGNGWIYRRALGSFIQRCVDGLAEYAATSSATPDAPAHAS